MAITEAYTSTQTVSSSELSLTVAGAGPGALTAAGVYQFFVDFNAIAAQADVFEIAVYEKTVSGGTQRKIFTARVAGIPSNPIWVSPSFVLLNGWDATIIKVAGTDRSIVASTRKVA